MIQKYVDRFMAGQESLRAAFAAKHPAVNYAEIVKQVVTVLREDEYEDPDPERIHTIDDGDYQGTLLFVIGVGGYQPSTYFYVKIAYGSCSGCDTLAGIHDSGSSGEPATEAQIADYMTLALHIVQGLKVLD